METKVVKVITFCEEGEPYLFTETDVTQEEYEQLAKLNEIHKKLYDNGNEQVTK